MPTILIIEDERELARVVQSYLEQAGMKVRLETRGDHGLAAWKQDHPDLVLLDLNLPGMDGLDVARQIRKGDETPIIMVTARAEETDRLIGLETGADDYVTKPFSPRELALRVRSVLRRAGGAVVPPGRGVLRDGDLVVDVGAHEVALRGESLSLTAREFDLLAFLLRHPRQAFTREALLERVWGWSFGDSSTVTVHVRRLREKVEADPTAPARIVTVWGVGYRYEPGGAPAEDAG
jgi:DNA-binding response OmpR family regulator